MSHRKVTPLIMITVTVAWEKYFDRKSWVTWEIMRGAGNLDEEVGSQEAKTSVTLPCLQCRCRISTGHQQILSNSPQYFLFIGVCTSIITSSGL
jgi:hypothetical protein